MPNIIFLESGSAATQDMKFWTANTFSSVSVGTPSFSGGRSIALAGNAAGSASVSKQNALADAGRRISLYIQFDALLVSRFLAFGNSGTSLVFGLDSSGLLTIRSGSPGTLLATGSTPLQINTWYRLSISYVVTSSTVYTVKVFLNGTPEVSASNSAAIAVAQTNLIILILSTNTSQHTYIQNVYIDDGNTLDDPGNVQVTAKLPASNNVNQFDTSIGNNPANRWLNVDERPLSELNGWEESASQPQVAENYGLETFDSGDVDLTNFVVVGRMAWIWAKKGATTGAGTPQLTDNGVDTAITLTTSSALYTKATTDSNYPSDPSGIGMKSSGAGAETFLYECGTLIAYTSPPVVPSAGSLQIGVSCDDQWLGGDWR